MSSITEKRDATSPLPGGFSIDLIPGTPRRVIDEIIAYPLNYVTIYPVHQPVEAIAAGAELDQSVYTGRMDRISSDLRTIEGASLCVLLGDEGGKGDIWKGTDFLSANDDWDGHFDSSLVAGSMNGLAKGTVATGGDVYRVQVNTGDNRREILTVMSETMPGTDFNWRVNPDGTIDADTPANLFTSGEVILTRDRGGHEMHITGFRAAMELGELDWTDLIGTAVVDWNDGTSNQENSNTLTNAVGIDGSTLVHEKYFTNRARQPKPSDRSQQRAWNIAESGRALSYAFAMTAQHDDARQELKITIDEYCPFRHMSVGDTIYVYDQLLDLIDTANEIQYRGELIHPAAARIMGWTVPVQEGEGVYLYRSDGAAGMELYDLTEWVAFSDATTSIEVGALSRSLTE